MEKIQNESKRSFINSGWESNHFFICLIFETIHNASKGMSDYMCVLDKYLKFMANLIAGLCFLWDNDWHFTKVCQKVHHMFGSDFSSPTVGPGTKEPGINEKSWKR